MINNLTPDNALPLPNIANQLSDDVPRIAESLTMIDGLLTPLDNTGHFPIANIPTAAMPVHTAVATGTAMVALIAKVGDTATRADTGFDYVLTSLPASNINNWKLQSASPVVSIGGQSGALTLSQIGIGGKAGGNLYAATGQMVATDWGKLIEVSSASAFSLETPSIAGVLAGFGFALFNTGTATVTLTPSSGAFNVKGSTASTFTLLPGMNCEIVWDGTNFVATESDYALTPPQFTNSRQTATAAFVQQALGNKAGQSAYTVTATMVTTDWGKLIEVNGAAAFTLTLPSTAGVTAGSALSFFNSGANNVTLSSTANINLKGTPATTFILMPGMNCDLIWDGSQFVVQDADYGLEAPQFDNSNRFATDSFVQRAMGNLAGAKSYTATATMVATDWGKLVEGGSATPFTLTLPSITGVLAGASLEFINTNAGVITLIPSSGIFNVNGVAFTTFTLAQGVCCNIIWDGANFILNQVPNLNQIRANPCYWVDTGVVNALVINPTPAYSSLTDGMTFLITAAFTNTGPATVMVNGIGPIAIVGQNATPLQGGELNGKFLLSYASSTNLFKIIGGGGAAQIMPAAFSNQAVSLTQIGGNYFSSSSNGSTSSISTSITFTAPYKGEYIINCLGYGGTYNTLLTGSTVTVTNAAIASQTEYNNICVIHGLVYVTKGAAVTITFNITASSTEGMAVNLMAVFIPTV